MAWEPWPLEKALGLLSVGVALAIGAIAWFVPPARTCLAAPGTGLCAAPFPYRSADSDRTLTYAALGFLVLVAGAFLITRGTDRPLNPASLSRGERRLLGAMVVLVLLGIALAGASVAAGYTAPPSRTVSFSDAQLADVGDLYTPYYGIARAATVYLTAGETVDALWSVSWTAAGSSTPLLGGGYATLQPAGEALNSSRPMAYAYVVPRTGSYTVWFYAQYPGYATGWTTNASLTVASFNVDYVPLAQLALGALGYGVVAAAVLVDWSLHPRWVLRRASA